MKSQIALAFVIAATPALAQQTGVSNPPDAVVQDVPAVATPVTAPATPSLPAPVTAPAQAAPAQEEFGAYKPYSGSAVTLQTHAAELAATSAANDPDAGIVTEVSRRADELPRGTSLRMRLHEEIATSTTQPDAPFTAELAEDVMNDGRVVMPAGSTIEGKVSQVRGGRRIHGTALIHLQVQNIVLPDGTRMPLRAAVVDTDQFADTRIDNEGNIRRKDHVGATLAVMSMTTGASAAAGAVFGGGVGALIGAGVGAGISTAWWLKQDRQTHLPKDSLVVLNLTEPMQLQPLAHGADFSIAPAKPSAAKPMNASDNATAVPPAPAYVAPQAFVPMN